MNAKGSTHSGCGCQSDTGRAPFKDHTLTRLNYVLNFGNESQAMIQQHLFDGKTLIKSFMTLFFDDHTIITKYDAQSEKDGWTIDRMSVKFDDDFLTSPDQWEALEAMRRTVNENKLAYNLFNVVSKKPHPALFTPLSLFAIQFAPDMSKQLGDVLKQIRTNPTALQVGTDDFTTGCYESGFCSAEYSSCTDCDESGDLLDWNFDPPGGGRGGGRGGGDDDGGDDLGECLAEYYEEMSRCYEILDGCTQRVALVLDPRTAPGIRSVRGHMLTPSALHQHLRINEINEYFNAQCYENVRQCMWTANLIFMRCLYPFSPFFGA